MADIKRLAIRGVRSFHPDREETIEFYSPLTMIVGANGCGKTSIIESLKYACTGAMPPSCSNGQSFVNDPTMTDATEVKASIKLRFTAKSGKPSVVVRAMQLTKKAKKMEFKALDGVVRTTNDRDEKVSTSHKCSEIDKLVPEMLGVSSAIMENVIFCHQEESSWPMSEGIILKKKFDDVFESTRYTKVCVHYLCLIGWVYVFYVGHVDIIDYMKLFSVL
jgi:DNA repair protein RAD50